MTVAAGLVLCAAGVLLVVAGCWASLTRAAAGRVSSATWLAVAFGGALGLGLVPPIVAAL